MTFRVTYVDRLTVYVNVFGKLHQSRRRKVVVSCHIGYLLKLPVVDAPYVAVCLPSEFCRPKFSFKFRQSLGAQTSHSWYVIAIASGSDYLVTMVPALRTTVEVRRL